MNKEVKTLKCFNKAPHESHYWTFLYDQPTTDYHCPGVKESKEK